MPSRDAQSRDEEIRAERIAGVAPARACVQCRRGTRKLCAVSSPPSAKWGSLGAAPELLAYAAIVPLVACPLAMAFLPSEALRLLAQQIAIAYGAVLLASFGAVHFGLALAGRLAWTPQRLAAAALPAVCAAASVVLSGQRGLALLVVASGLFWLYEHRRVGHELPEDYLRLRRNLTVAGLSLLAIIMILSDSVGLP
jgi:hypothetical protein